MRFDKASRASRQRSTPAARGRTRRGVRPRLKRRIAPQPGSARRARKAAASSEFGPPPCPLLLGFAFWFLVAALFAALFLRHLLARPARFGKSDRDRLLAALDLLAGTAALQRALFAFLHRAFDFLGRAFGIFPCHKVFSRLWPENNPNG